MSPEHVFESYVRAVGRNLPGKMRYEVAQDLRLQLADELAGRAAETGRAPDGALALDVARGFGRPEDLAAQYQAPFAIIEPNETRRFVVFVVIGYGMLSTLVVTLRRLDAEAARDFDLDGLGWIGLCTIIFGIRAWLKRKKDREPKWLPAAHFVDLDRLNLRSFAISVTLTVLLLAAYLWPGQAAQLLSGGQATANDFAYAPQFADPRYLRFPWLIGVLIYLLAVDAVVVFQRRWTRLTRWLYIFGLFHVALQLGWHMAYPAPVFASPAAETIVFPIVSLIVLAVGIDLWLRVLREWDWIEPPKPAG
jgi:hypothetical protein